MATQTKNEQKKSDKSAGKPNLQCYSKMLQQTNDRQKLLEGFGTFNNVLLKS